MTKRLFAYFGLSVLGVYTVVFYFGFYGLCAAAVLVLGLIFYALAVKKPAVEKSVIILVAVTVVLSSAAFTVYDGAFRSLGERFNEQTVTMTANVKSDGEKRYGTYYYELNAEKIDSDDVDLKVMLHSNLILSCEYGDTIRVKAKLTSCDEDYYRSRRFVYSAESDSFKLDYTVLKKGRKGFCYFPVYLRDKFSEAVQTVVKGDNGELCSVMTFGNREQLSGDINALFSKTGLSFLVVISGLHMSIISVFLLYFLRPLSKRKCGNYIRCGIVVVFILLYMIITGLTASVVRSGIAIILSIIAVSFKRRSDAYNNLGLAALILTAVNPYAVGDIGMLLSFSSVLGILYFHPRLCRRIEDSYFERQKELYLEINRTNQLKRQLRFKLHTLLLSITMSAESTLFVSVSSIIVSMPIVCLAIGFVSPAALFSSFILVPLTAGVVIFSLLTALVYYIPLVGFLSYFIGAVADVLSGMMIAVVRFVCSVPYLTLYLDRDTVWMWIIVFAVLLGMVILLKLGKKHYLTAFMLSVVFLVGSYSVKYIIHSNSVTVKVIGTGSPCVRITGGGIEALLSYGGDYDKFSELTRKLRYSCGDVKTLIVPDDSLKTSRFAVNILDEFDVKRVMLYHSKRTPLDPETQAMSVKDYEEFYSSDVVTLNLGQGVKETLINDGKSTWQYIKSDTASVLIAPDRADAQRLDESFRSAEFIVCGAEIKNIDLLDYKNSHWITRNDLKEDFNIKIK